MPRVPYPHPILVSIIFGVALWAAFFAWLLS